MRMKGPTRSADPHYLNWPRPRQHPQNVNNNCFSYAVGNHATVTEFADRMTPAIRQPDPGDNIGMPAKIYTLAHGYNAQSFCRLAELSGLKPLQVPEFGLLPKLPAGERLVAMVFLPSQDIAATNYHWVRQGPDGLFTGHVPEEGPTDRDSYGHIVTDPRYAQYRQNQQGPFFFSVPEQGLDLRMKAPWPDLVHKAYMLQLGQPPGFISRELGKTFAHMAQLIDDQHFPKVRQTAITVAQRHGADVRSLQARSASASLS
jgi:hypothetical protein